jgi:hypothetical protein
MSQLYRVSRYEPLDDVEIGSGWHLVCDNVSYERALGEVHRLLWCNHERDAIQVDRLPPEPGGYHMDIKLPDEEAALAAFDASQKQPSRSHVKASRRNATASRPEPRKTIQTSFLEGTK